jgi:hypothetical protein
VGHNAGIPAVVAHAGRIWPHWAVQPTIGATPNAVPHLPPRGTTLMYISRNFLFDHLFYENQGKINIKKIELVAHICGAGFAHHTHNSSACIQTWKHLLLILDKKSSCKYTILLAKLQTNLQVTNN